MALKIVGSNPIVHPNENETSGASSAPLLFAPHWAVPTHWLRAGALSHVPAPLGGASPALREMVDEEGREAEKKEKPSGVSHHREKNARGDGRVQTERPQPEGDERADGASD